jgi:hypothetical protein
MMKDPGHVGENTGHMQDGVNTLMLVCAALASLAFGVLLAYGVCRAAFAKLLRHAGEVAAQRAQAQMAPSVSQPDTL